MCAMSNSLSLPHKGLENLLVVGENCSSAMLETQSAKEVRAKSN